VSFDYGRSKATADRLIGRFGQAAALKRPNSSGPAYAPVEGTPTSYAVTVVVNDYRNAEIDGTRVQSGDKKVMMAKGSLAIEPTTSDTLVIGGKEHAIVEVRPLNPGGTVILYEVQARA
jgi:hypothetical protein